MSYNHHISLRAVRQIPISEVIKLSERMPVFWAEWLLKTCGEFN